MEWFLATIAGAFVFGSGGFIIRLGTTRHPDSGLVVLLGLYITGTLCFVGLAAAQGMLTFTPEIFIWGLVVGFRSVLGNRFWVRAFNAGPTSLTGPLVNGYNVLIILMSIWLFGESLRWNEVAGVALILLAVSLISYDPDETLRVSDRWWYGFIALAIVFFFMRTAGLKFTEEAGLPNTVVLAYGYAVGIVWFGASLRGRPEIRRPEVWRFALGLGLVSGVFSFGGMQLFAYAIESGPASIVAPIFSMNGLVFATLTVLLLGERLSRYQILALLGSVAGLVLLRI